MRKILMLSVLSCIASLSLANPVVQPVIQGKSYNRFQITHVTPKKTFGAPLKIVKGEVDECNGGHFPDQWVYDSFIVLENGRIDKVYLKMNNAVKINNIKIDGKITETQFKKKFSPFIFDLEPHVYDLEIAKDSNDSVTFYFKNGHLDYYQFNFDDC
ncbi:hypothetical protein [Acinetobacter rongchengensis]|uniref:Uncharacterized protein n=1 Tax=Acinetobacter rongchengensis TaxID=2419601 RepID=A0A3A8F184_9GAMM|nr:hypothetical protein [Acinetobacter rongchengensis]RKG40099.1 hypothetical protein D7V20_03235 [Acinetobacter rongchengensis]